MLGYDFEIIYRKGKQNGVVDALSRKDEDVEALFCDISIIKHDWLDGTKRTKDGWTSDIKLSAIVGLAHKNPFEVVTRNCGKLEHGTYKE